MADDLSYLETVDDSKRLEKPKSTGTKLLAVIAPDDDCLDPNTENYIDGAKAGGFLIRSSNMYIPAPVTAIPMDFKQMYGEFEPDRGGFIRYVSMEEGNSIAVDPYKFGAKTTKKGKMLQDTYCFIAALPEYDNMLCMISFTSSRIPDGEEWFRTIDTKEHNGNIIAHWNQVYTIDTRMKRTTKGNWFLIKPKFDRFVNLEEHKAVTEIRASVESFGIGMLEDNTDSEY